MTIFIVTYGREYLEAFKTREEAQTYVGIRQGSDSMCYKITEKTL